MKKTNGVVIYGQFYILLWSATLNSEGRRRGPTRRGHGLLNVASLARAHMINILKWYVVQRDFLKIRFNLLILKLWGLINIYSQNKNLIFCYDIINVLQLSLTKHILCTIAIKSIALQCNLNSTIFLDSQMNLVAAVGSSQLNW